MFLGLWTGSHGFLSMLLAVCSSGKETAKDGFCSSDTDFLLESFGFSVRTLGLTLVLNLLLDEAALKDLIPCEEFLCWIKL